MEVCPFCGTDEKELSPSVRALFSMAGVDPYPPVNAFFFLVFRYWVLGIRYWVLGDNQQEGKRQEPNTEHPIPNTDETKKGASAGTTTTPRVQEKTDCALSTAKENLPLNSPPHPLCHKCVGTRIPVFSGLRAEGAIQNLAHFARQDTRRVGFLKERGSWFQDIALNQRGVCVAGGE